MNETQLVMVGSVCGSLVTALLTGVVMVINALHKNRQELRTTQFSEQGAIIDRQEKQIERLEAQIKEQQAAITKIQQDHIECRETSAQLHMYLALLYDYAHRQYTSMMRAGIAADPPPEMPDLAKDAHDASFLVKTTQQNTALLAKVDEKLKTDGAGS